MKKILSFLTFVLISFSVNSASIFKNEEPAAFKAPTLITLGVDGIYGPLFEEMMDNGELPTFQKIRDMSAWTLEGKTIYRSHSLIAWSALLYGREPTFTQKMKDTFLDVNRSEVATRNHGKTSLCNALGNASTTYVTTNWRPIGDIIPNEETTNDVVPSINEYGDDQQDSLVFGKIQSAINSQKYTSIFAQLDYSDWLAQQVNILDGQYAAALKAVDDGLKAILENHNLDFKNRDYLCITSDHGRHSWFSLSCIIPKCWAPGIKHDCLCCATVKHIPVFIAGPGIKNHKIDEPISIVDIAPSLLNLMGKDKGDMEGKVINFK